MNNMDLSYEWSTYLKRYQWTTWILEDTNEQHGSKKMQMNKIILCKKKWIASYSTSAVSFTRVFTTLLKTCTNHVIRNYSTVRFFLVASFFGQDCRLPPEEVNFSHENVSKIITIWTLFRSEIIEQNEMYFKYKKEF